MSFRRHYHCGKLSLFSGATAVQSGRPKSHTFTVNFAVFAPQPRWRQKPWKGLLSTELRYAFQGDSSYLCVIWSSNSTRYCFGTVYHYSATVDVLGK